MQPCPWQFWTQARHFADDRSSLLADVRKVCSRVTKSSLAALGPLLTLSGRQLRLLERGPWLAKASTVQGRALTLREGGHSDAIGDPDPAAVAPD